MWCTGATAVTSTWYILYSVWSNGYLLALSDGQFYLMQERLNEHITSSGPEPQPLSCALWAKAGRTPLSLQFLHLILDRAAGLTGVAVIHHEITLVTRSNRQKYQWPSLLPHHALALAGTGFKGTIAEWKIRGRWANGAVKDWVSEPGW